MSDIVPLDQAEELAEPNYSTSLEPDKKGRLRRLPWAYFPQRPIDDISRLPGADRVFPFAPVTGLNKLRAYSEYSYFYSTVILPAAGCVTTLNLTNTLFGIIYATAQVLVGFWGLPTGGYWQPLQLLFWINGGMSALLAVALLIHGLIDPKNLMLFSIYQSRTAIILPLALALSTMGAAFTLFPLLFPWASLPNLAGLVLWFTMILRTRPELTLPNKWGNRLVDQLAVGWWLGWEFLWTARLVLVSVYTLLTPSAIGYEVSEWLTLALVLALVTALSFVSKNALSMFPGAIWLILAGLFYPVYGVRVLVLLSLGGLCAALGALILILVLVIW